MAGLLVPTVQKLLKNVQSNGGNFALPGYGRDGSALCWNSRGVTPYTCLKDWVKLE